MSRGIHNTSRARYSPTVLARFGGAIQTGNVIISPAPAIITRNTIPVKMGFLGRVCWASITGHFLFEHRKNKTWIAAVTAKQGFIVALSIPDYALTRRV